MTCDFCKQTFDQKDGILLSITDYHSGHPITTQSPMCPQCEKHLNNFIRVLINSNYPNSYLDRSDSYYKLKYDDTPYAEGEEK